MAFPRRVLAGLCALLVPAALVPGCGGDNPSGTPIQGTSSGVSSSGAADAEADGASGPCGNGALDPAEACDDTNTVDGDDCSADCKQVESGFTCTRVGTACASLCGDGVRVGDEICDDGNTRG